MIPRGCACVLIALAAIFAAVASVGAEPAVAAPQENPVTLEITEISPAAIAPDSAVTIRGVITNTGQAAIEGGEIDLKFSGEPITDQAQIASWATTDTIDEFGWSAAAVSLGSTVQPGQTRAFTLSFDASRLGLADDPATFGAYEMRIDLATRIEVLATTRSFLLWQPSDAVQHVGLATLLPLTGGAAASADGARSRAAHLVDETTDAGVDWLVDPALLTEPTDPSDDKETRAADKAASASLAEALAAHPGQVYLLPWGDADAEAIAHAGQDSLYAKALDFGDTAAETAGLSPVPEHLAWPASGRLDQSVAAMLAATPPAATLLMGAEGGDETPTGLTARGVDGLATTAVNEQTGGALLYSSQTLTELILKADADDPVDMQRLGANLATLAAQTLLDADAPQVLIAPDRSWKGDGAPLAGTLGALGALPFVRGQAVGQLLDAPGSAEVSLPHTKFETSEASANELTSTSGAFDLARRYAAITPDPDAIEDAVTPALLTPLGVEWRTIPVARADAVKTATDAVDDMVGNVSIATGSTLTFVARAGAIPVTVINEADYPVSVGVTLHSESPRLVPGEPQYVTVPAKSEQQVRVEVEAIASADTVIEAYIVNPAGEQVTDPVSMPIRIRASWEDTATVVAAAIFALILVGGLARTIRRRRRDSEQA